MADGPGERSKEAGHSERCGWSRVIGIVGGLGPHAHIQFERLLLREAEARTPGRILRDQDYPPYLVSCQPGTPDRTEYLLHQGPSPIPWLESSLLALRGGYGSPERALVAEFAVIACNTAHAVLPELRAKAILPILDIVGETVAPLAARGQVRKIGLLATSGTLEAGIYQNACATHDLAAISLLDLPGGIELQRSLVMAAIYGDTDRPGIKAGAHHDPEHRGRLVESLERAASLLADAGADVVLGACTEIPLVLTSREGLGVEIIDPLEIAARAALATAAGEREAELESVDFNPGKA